MPVVTIPVPYVIVTCHVSYRHGARALYRVRGTVSAFDDENVEEKLPEHVIAGILLGSIKYGGKTLVRCGSQRLLADRFNQDDQCFAEFLFNYYDLEDCKVNTDNLPVFVRDILQALESEEKKALSPKQAPTRKLEILIA